MVDQIRNEFVPGQDKGFVGEFKIGGSHFLASHHLIEAWSLFQRDNPALVGEVCPGRTADIVRAVLSGTLDLGLCFSPLKHPDLEIQALQEGQMLLVVRKDHQVLKDMRHSKRTLARLSDFPAVIHKAAPGVDICEDHPELVRHGIKCQIANYFESDDLAVKTISSSDSWSLLPDIVVRQHRKVLAELPLPRGWNAPYTVSAIVRKSRKDSPIIGLFLKTLTRLLAGL